MCRNQNNGELCAMLSTSDFDQFNEQLWAEKIGYNVVFAQTDF